MKKLLLIGIAVALVGGMALAQPADVTAQVNVTAVVNGVWRLTLSTNAINYALDPGQTDNTQSVVAYVRTNQNLQWYLKINKDHDLSNGTPVDDIPSANFTYTGSGGLGPWVNGEFPSSATVCYTAAASEFKVVAAPGLALTTTYSLTIPDDQTAGTYTNTITYTLTVTL